MKVHTQQSSTPLTKGMDSAVSSAVPHVQFEKLPSSTACSGEPQQSLTLKCGSQRGSLSSTSVCSLASAANGPRLCAGL